MHSPLPDHCKFHSKAVRQIAHPHSTSISYHPEDKGQPCLHITERTNEKCFNYSDTFEPRQTTGSYTSLSFQFFYSIFRKFTLPCHFTPQRCARSSSVPLCSEQKSSDTDTKTGEVLINTRHRSQVEGTRHPPGSSNGLPTTIMLFTVRTSLCGYNGDRVANHGTQK